MKRILVVLPHPDDEVFPMSGTLSKYIKEGALVTYACLTLGEMGRNLGNPAFANRITLPAVRKKELETSCGIIGIQDLRMLGYHDKTIEFEPHDLLDQRIMAIIEEVKPELVMSFYPGYGVHPDHDACGAAVIRTLQKMPKALRPKAMCCAFPNQELGEPDVFNDISPFIDQKMGALKAHSSQFNLDLYMGPNGEGEEAFMKRIQSERFWYYKFED